MSSFAGLSNDQVITLYEQSNGEMTPEMLVEAFDGTVSLTAIKMALMQGSRLYRQKINAEEELFTKDDQDLAIATMRQLCMGADSDAVRFRAAQKMFDVRTGRDVGNIARGANFNMTMINQYVVQAEEAIKKAKEKVVEINPEHKHLMEMVD